MTQTGAEKALEYCHNILGWNDAYIPSKKEIENLWMESDTVYKYKPKDFWDTPDVFYFNWLDKER